MTRKRSVPRFADVEPFGAALWSKACEYGCGEVSVKAFIGDGIHRIRGIAEVHLPPARLRQAGCRERT